MNVSSQPIPAFATSEPSTRLHADAQHDDAGALTLAFDGDYEAGQRVGLMVDDEVYIYCVTDRDVGHDDFVTQSNVARGMLAALVNGGFSAFPRTQPTLVGNRLCLIPFHAHSVPRIDVVYARNLWCN